MTRASATTLPCSERRMRDSKRTARSRRHSRCIDVPSSLTLRAYEELGETSELRAGSLQQLRSEVATLVEQRVAGWEDLQRALEQPDLWLVRFLRTRKYDSARALHALRGNLSLSRYLEGLPARTGGAKPGAVAAVRFWDLHIKHSSVRYVLDRRLLATVPGRARDGSAVVLLSPSSDFLVAWGRLGVGGFTLAVLKLIEALSLEPRTQLCGITVVVDLRRASSALISTSLRPDMLRLTERLASLLGSKAAFRVRGLWIVGAPWYARALVNLVRTFLSSKLRTRLHLCSAADDLHAAVEPRLLPAGFGAGGGADEGGVEASFEECLLALQRRESSTRTSLRSSSSSEPLVRQRPRQLSPT